jgi:hypothetical protein
VITFGPYVHLAPGRYRAQLTYSSPASSKQQVGVFDVAQSSRSWASLPILGTDDAEKTIDIDFEVGATEEWQFRTLWTGGGPLTILGLHSEPIG